MSEESRMSDQEAAEAQAPVVDEAKPSDGPESPPKKKMKLGPRILIIVGIVVVVLAGGGGGAYAVFHSNPAFCNFVCHTPMDPYVVSYEEGTSVNATQTDLTAPLSVVAHKESHQQLNCLDCHVPTMSEQINEGIKWVSGNYEIPLEMKMVSSQIKEDSGDKNGVEFCLRPECHEGITTLEELKAATADQHRNPHDSHLGNQDCSNCHQTHEQSVYMCTQCHNDVENPDGWLTYKEQQDQNKQLESTS
jgi:hypothetical protein